MKNISPYSSHFDILKFLIEFTKKETVLEFGTGEGEFSSTKLFLEKFISLTSIEMNSPKWFEKTKHSGSIFCPGMFEFKKLQLGRFDLIFVDGHADSRPEQINWSINHTDLIVAHDTEEKMYGFDERVKIPEGWVWIDIVQYRPWTSVLTKKIEIIDNLKEKFNCVFENKSYTPNISRDAIIWVTKLGPTSFSKYNPEWRAHLELQKYGIDSRWLCYFPKSDAHLDAELTKNTRIIEMDNT